MLSFTARRFCSPINGSIINPQSRKFGSLFNLSRPARTHIITITGFEPSPPTKFTGPYLLRPVEDAPTLEEWRKYNYDPLGHLDAAERQKQNDTIYRHVPVNYKKPIGYIYNKEDTKFFYGRTPRQAHVHMNNDCLQYALYDILVWVPTNVVKQFYYCHGMIGRWVWNTVIGVICVRFFWKFYLFLLHNGQERRDLFLQYAQTDHKMYYGYWDSGTGPDPVKGIHPRFGW